MSAGRNVNFPRYSYVHREMAIITSTISAHIYIEFLDNFLIPSVENRFGNDEVISQDDNTSCQTSKKDFINLH